MAEGGGNKYRDNSITDGGKIKQSGTVIEKRNEIGKILYLDRLRRPPLRWNVSPRIMVWSRKRINKAQAADRCATGDFGKIECLDVAYNERHPNDARDTLKKDDDLLEQVAFMIRAMNGDAQLGNTRRTGRKRRGPTTDKNPYQYKCLKGQATVRRECSDERGSYNGCDASSPKTPNSSSTPTMDGSNMTTNSVDIHNVIGNITSSVDGLQPVSNLNVNELSKWFCWNEPQEGINSSMPTATPKQTWSPPHGQVGSCIYHTPQPITNGTHSESQDSGDENDSNDPLVESDSNQVTPNVRLQRSRTQRKLKCSCKILSTSFLQMWRRRGLMHYKKKLGSLLKSENDEIVSGDTIIFECNGVGVSLHACSTLSSPTCQVDTQYVRVASLVYEKVWQSKYKDRSKRIMFNPRFADDVLRRENDVFNINWMEDLSSTLAGSATVKINTIFVPVFQGSWWCATISLNSKEIAVIDPFEPSQGLDVHHMELPKLLFAVDEVLHYVDPAWKIGTCSSYKPYSVRMNRIVEYCDSGVLMLIAIKRLADRLAFGIQMDNWAEEREWLICEDVLSHRNEQREFVKTLLRKMKRAS